MKKPLPSIPRTAISNLAVATKMFAPIIVDDSGNKWTGAPHEAPPGFGFKGKFEPRLDLKEGQTPPTFDELINIAGGAIMEIRGFIENHEHLKKVLSVTQEAFAHIESIVLGASEKDALQPQKTTEVIREVFAEHAHMKSALEKAASSTPEQALKTAQAWVFKNGIKPPLFQAIEGQTPSEN